MNNFYSNLKIKSHQWDRLLNEIENKKLLPIIGHELLEIEIDGNKTTFYEHIAKKVMQELELEEINNLPPKSLADVAYLYRKQYADHSSIDVYHISEKIINARDWPIPDTLLKLAEITHFDIFVSITPDNLMVQALDQVRFEGKHLTNVFSYSPQTELEDLPDAYGMVEEEVPVLFKLFGDINMRPDYVITEEDVLKFVHHLQIQDRCPTNLFHTLDSRSLAILGCSFDNWLIRFFLCSAKSTALFTTSGTWGVIADQNTHKDKALLPFLRRNNTLLFTDGDAIDFVNELHKRWMSKYKNNPQLVSEEQKNNSFDHIFICYASEDQEFAEKTKKVLVAQGVSVWMDTEQLNPGEEYTQMIQKNIRGCSVFIPIISKHSLTYDRRYFRREWDMAIEESKMRPSSHPFIQPLAIDDTLEQAENIPPRFTQLHWSRYPDGNIDEVYAKNLIRKLRRHQQKVDSFKK